MPVIPRVSLTVVEERFRDLVRVVQKCVACPGMEGRKRVLTEKNGPSNVDLMFIAEAPGKDGADRTGVPLFGDPTGFNFERLLESVKLTRAEVFITNSVLCNPRDEKGNNRAPSEEESRNCSFHLENTIVVVNPLVIVTLGKAALNSLNLIHPHSISLREDVGTDVLWNGRTVFPMYHSSPRVLVHRSMEQQRQDFKRLMKIVNYKKGIVG